MRENHSRRPEGPRTRAKRARQFRTRVTVGAVAAVLVVAGIWGVSAMQSSDFRKEPVAAVTPTPEPTPEPTPTPTPEPTPTPTPEPTRQEKLDFIVSNRELYPDELIGFAQKYPQTIDYVYAYPEKKDLTYEIDLSEETSGEGVPLFIQWDERWGYAEYGGGVIGYNGCGPVSMSMVTVYLTGDTSWTPVAVAEFSEENGYYIPGSGTTWDLMSQGAAGLGLHVEIIPLVREIMVSELDKGHPIVVAVGPGDFTYAGHYMVIVGYDDEGFIINDPNSPENSAKRWPFSRISSQIWNLWAMSRAEETT